MIHDIDAVLHLTGQTPSDLSAVGVAVLSSTEDIANARLEFANGCVANLTASRVSVERLRRIRFFTRNSYVSVDLFEKAARRSSSRTGLVQARPRGSAVAAGRHQAHETRHRQRRAADAGADRVRALAARRRRRAASARAGRDALAVAEQVREAMRARARQWSLA
jgi:predicted dehydrogenase